MSPLMVSILISAMIISCMIFLVCSGYECTEISDDEDMENRHHDVETNPAATTTVATATLTTTWINNIDYNYNNNNNNIHIQRLPSVSEHIILATDVVRVSTPSFCNAHKSETDGTVIQVHMDSSIADSTVNQNSANSRPMEC